MGLREKQQFECCFQAGRRNGLWLSCVLSERNAIRRLPRLLRRSLSHTVEVDSTFYACPTPRTVSNWAARTPENFVFSVKVPQAVTHEKVLVDCDAELAEFFGTMDLLAAKLGPMVFQFPAFDRWKFPTQKHFLELLAPFLMKLPRDRKFAVEIRNKNWIPMKSSEPNESKKKYQKEYFRVTIPYTDGEFSGRVFKERAKAEKYALRQRKSPVVKNTKIEPFTRNQYEWHRSRMMPQDTTDTSKK